MMVAATVPVTGGRRLFGSVARVVLLFILFLATGVAACQLGGGDGGGDGGNGGNGGMSNAPVVTVSTL